MARVTLVLAGAVLLLLYNGDCHLEVNPLSFLRHDRVSENLESAIKLVAYPGLLGKSGDWIQFSWSGVSDPAKTDWIGIFLLPTKADKVDASNHAPIKYQYCNFSNTHLKKGQGVLYFHMVNMRAIYRIAFFRGGFENPMMVAVSNPVEFQNPNEPLHGHFSLTNNISMMMFMWVTRDTSAPVLRWGTERGQYTNTANATSSTYLATDMCDSPAMDYGWVDPGMIHKVTLTDLAPNTTYYYRYGDSAYGWSDEFMFKSPPIPGPDVHTKVLIFGDMGHGEYDDSRQVLKLEPPSLNTTKNLISQMNFHDLVVHIGDISYADGYEGIWDEYFEQVKLVFARLPYMVNPGNHESDSANYPDAIFHGHDSGGECDVPYKNRFAMPTPGQDQPWYGFDYGCIHFVMMSTEHNYNMSSKQHTFLDKHMQAVNRSVTPWLIFAGHRPMYIDSTNKTEPSGELPVAKTLVTHIEPLLKTYKVDLAFWGHHHSYQRMKPVYNNTLTPGATTHIVIGMAGRSLLHNLKPQQPDFVEFVDDQHWGYCRIEANATRLIFQYFHNDGKLADMIVLTKA